MKTPRKVNKKEEKEKELFENLKKQLLDLAVPTEPSKKQIKEFKQKIKSLEEWHKSRREKLEDKKREIALRKSSIPSLEQEIEAYEIERKEQKESFSSEWEEKEKALQIQLRRLGRKRKFFWAGGILLAGVIAFLGVFGFSRQLEELERERVSKLEIIDVPKASEELEQALKEQQEELEALEEERQNLLDKKESLQKEYENLISIEN